MHNTLTALVLCTCAAHILRMKTSATWNTAPRGHHSVSFAMFQNLMQLDHVPPASPTGIKQMELQKHWGKTSA